jgi:hypothetical protein
MTGEPCTKDWQCQTSYPEWCQYCMCGMGTCMCPE